MGVEVPDAENCHLANTTTDVQCAGLLPDLGHYYYIFQVDFIPEYSTWSTRYQNTLKHITRVQYLEHSIPEYHTWNTQCQSKLPGSLNTKVHYLEHSIPKYSTWNTQYQSTVPGTLDTGV